MPYSVEGKLVVAISSRALFDFEEENRIFDRDGEAAYIALQFARLDVPAREGVAFPLLRSCSRSTRPRRSASRS
jgi:5'-nucleotidase